jgi:hypothetical protein
VDLANTSGCHLGTDQTIDFGLVESILLNIDWATILITTNKIYLSYVETSGQSIRLPSQNEEVWRVVRAHRIINRVITKIINKGASVELNCPDQHLLSLRTRYPPNLMNFKPTPGAINVSMLD